MGEKSYFSVIQRVSKTDFIVVAHGLSTIQQQHFVDY